MLDTMIFDLIVATPGLPERVKGATERGLLQIFTTYVQESQLERMPNKEKLETIRLIPRGVISTSTGIYGLSVYGGSRFGGNVNDVNKVSQGKSKHIEDALIAATANFTGIDAFVTDEQGHGRLPNRMRRQGIQVEIWGWTRFREYVEGL